MKSIFFSTDSLEPKTCAPCLSSDSHPYPPPKHRTISSLSPHSLVITSCFFLLHVTSYDQISFSIYSLIPKNLCFCLTSYSYSHPLLCTTSFTQFTSSICPYFTLSHCLTDGQSTRHKIRLLIKRENWRTEGQITRKTNRLLERKIAKKTGSYTVRKIARQK